MTVGFMLRTGPYTSQNADTVYNIAKRLLSKGHSIRIYLYEDGVCNVVKQIKSPQERNIRDMMAELVASGVEIKACGTCAKFRGIRKTDIIEGTNLAGMAVLARFARDCDRFLSFGF
ncbi:sulfurtransferase TusD [candidate division WOR-3 bacterium]|uniref:Sulfurtransferase TusD n=1 Tax=candidate division WOR-3 bacterium TaxID=2052148 RepID=A0A9D5KCJ4_UNCW3|nr:sulfurtransferase TusD [candidate division WOR-3 bacterium]MBD3365590.1 sulfurtransferase TusD [candidate division WOR-3 bacterium]